MTNHRPPRILIACDKFKGSLSADEACSAIATGIRRVMPDARIEECPIADGGEGFAEAIIRSQGGVMVDCPALDARGRAITARYGILERDRTRIAVMEMAAAAGLWRLAEDERDPCLTDTRGVGMMMRDAVTRYHPDHILLGIGGSATNDGGAGMIAALGARLLDADGHEIEPHPAALARLAAIDLSQMMRLPEIVVGCDVTNPLLGEKGAAAVFAPQKGADPPRVAMLESVLETIVRVSEGDDVAQMAGAGAAGGLGFALMRFCGAHLATGFDLIADAVGLAGKLAASDIVVTGEGSLDAQSLAGKGPAAVAMKALLAARPVVALVGRADQMVSDSGLFHHIGAVLDRGYPVEEAIRRGAELLAEEATMVPWMELLSHRPRA